MYGLKVVNITDCLIFILNVVRLIVTIIGISIILSITIITIMIFLFHQSFSLRKRTV